MTDKLLKLHYEYHCAMYHEYVMLNRYGAESPEYENAKQATFKASDAYWDEKRKEEA